MPPIIDGAEIVSIIASSTTGYMAQFSPIFIFVGAIILAVVIIEILINFIPLAPDRAAPDFDFAKAEELKYFYSKKGTSGAAYDKTKMTNGEL